MSSKIKFQKFNVCTATGAKARVWYSLDNHIDHRACVNISDKDYGHALSRVFAGVDGIEYRNDTDSQTDYFDKGRARILEGHPLYADLRAMVAAWKAADAAKSAAKRLQKWAKSFYVEEATGTNRTRCAGARVAGSTLELLEVATGEWRAFDLASAKFFDDSNRMLYL